MVLGAACLLMGAGACVQPPSPSASPDAQRSSAPPPGASARQPPAAPPPAKDAGLATLPPLPSVAGEDKLQNALYQYVKEEISGAGTEGKISPDNGLKAAETVLKQAALVLNDKETSMRLFMYKYALRYLVERVLFLDPEADKKDAALAFFTKGQGHWVALNSEWEFEPFEEANYAVLYGSGKVTPRGPEGQTDAVPNPIWSTQVLLAIRTRNLSEMSRLHEAAGFGEAPQWPLEVYRQLFTYATTHRGEEQWDKISRVFNGKEFKGASWAEIGYGTGMIFPVLRRELGEDAKLYGTEIDDGCVVLVTLMERSGKAGWGHVELLPSRLDDCMLPENSVDFIHPGLVHIADGPDELVERDWLPLLASMKKALKPGGLLIIDNGGTPPLEKVRSVMARAGFEEVAVYVEDGTVANGLPIYYASYRAK
ncbi:class I SAM-dependent methyltransferase [bacterium]|nr:class I SAM-dependent methyltransferase [bacterium]